VGTYRLIKRLAVGGMAEVFLAKIVGAEGFEKPVAIKRILPSYGQEESSIALFLREARLSVVLQHANVVQVLDLGSAGGQFYMVMEFVDGENLRALLKAVQTRRVPLSLREACFITQQVAEALAYAHSRTDRSGAPLNIVHRDVNPSNVMIASTGEVKLADFGIAKAADGHKETQSGILKGKINYLSPEQVLGLPVGQRSDIFLLGLLLYELLSGRQLFDGSSVQIVQRLASFDACMLAPIPGVPEPLWAMVQLALATDPEARFRTAHEFSEALQSFLFDHRLRVSTSDIASLFARAFPDRRSPLEDLAGNSHEEIRLEGDPASASPRGGIRAAPPKTPPPLPPVLRPASPPSPPPVPLAVPPPAPALSREVPTRSSRPGAPLKARGSRRIGEILLAQGALSRESLEVALTVQRRTGGKLGQVLADEGLADAEQIVRALSEQSGLPSITDEKLQSMAIPREQLRRIPVELCEKLCAVPVALRGRELLCAVREPRDLAVLDALKFAAGVGSVRGLFASESAIRRAIWRFYRSREHRVPLAVEGAEACAARVSTMQFAEQFMGRPALDEAALSNAAAPRAQATPLSVEVEEESAPLEGVLLPDDEVLDAPSPCKVLVVSDAPEPRALAMKLLMSQGIAAEACPAASAQQALSRGGYELALLAEDAVGQPTALVQRLRAAFPGLEVRVLPSFREGLLGEGGPLAKLQLLHMRLLGGAMALLGGCAVMEPYLVRLARRIAARMGATTIEETLAGAAASVIALAARLEEPRRFVLPDPLRVCALVGSEFPEVAAILAAVLPEAGEARPLTGRTESATLCAVAFGLEVQSVHPGPAEAARAFQALRRNSRLPLAALEALATELGTNERGASVAAQVLVAEGDAASAMTLQICLMAEGLCMRRARTRGEVEQLAAAGVQAVVLATQLQDGESLSLVRALRKAPATARLPIFLLAAKEDSARVAAGLEAGADDVLLRPLNVEVLMAKLRRSLAQRQAPQHQMSAS
jgi:serine/threonine protein kinase/CheY-like chemotaxis protein